MKKCIILCLLAVPLFLLGQNEYRITGTYLGNNSTGLRNFHVDMEVLQSGKWKWMHKCEITTGSNLDMATVQSDTNYAARSWKDLMADVEIKELYMHFMDTYLQRIDAADISKLNMEENTTGNTITLDRSSNLLTVQVRGVEGDKRMWIDICSLDNHYFIAYNKPLIQYSANLVDLSIVRLKPADYIVKVSPNKGAGFSWKLSVY